MKSKPRATPPNNDSFAATHSREVAVVDDFAASEERKTRANAWRLMVLDEREPVYYGVPR